MYRLVVNKIRCKFCGDIIESRFRHDFVRCRCGKCAADGGQDYALRAFDGENPADVFEDMSTYKDMETGRLMSAAEALADQIPYEQVAFEVKEVREAPDAVQVVEERGGETDYLVSSKIIHPAEDELLKVTVEEEPDISEEPEAPVAEAPKEEKVFKGKPYGKK